MRIRDMKRRDIGHRDAVTIGVLLAGVIGGGALASSLSNSPSAPPAPTVEPVTAMPTVDSQAVQQEKARSIADQRRRRGRISTILSDPGLADQPLGGA